MGIAAAIDVDMVDVFVVVGTVAAVVAAVVVVATVVVVGVVAVVAAVFVGPAVRTLTIVQNHHFAVLKPHRSVFLI